MAVKLVFLNNNLEQISLRCKICRVTNLCTDPIRPHCIACGQRLPRRYKRLPDYYLSRYSYHLAGVE